MECPIFRNSGVFTAIAALLVATSRSAWASTLPRVDFERGDRLVAVGLLDVDFDYAVTGNWSIGASMIPYPNTSIAWYDPVLSPMAASLRSTYRLGTVWGCPIGVTVSGGTYAVIPSTGSGQALLPGTPFLRFESAAYLQPALDLTVPLTRGDAGWTLRLTAGPSFVLDPAHRRIFPLIPNLEIAKSFGKGRELTFLGDGLVGWRSVF